MTINLQAYASQALGVQDCREEKNNSSEYTHYIFSSSNNSIELFEINNRYYLAYESFHQESNCGREFRRLLPSVEVLGPKLSTIAPGSNDKAITLADQLSEALKATNVYFIIFAETLRLKKNNGRDFSVAEVVVNDAFTHKAQELTTQNVTAIIGS